MLLRTFHRRELICVLLRQFGVQSSKVTVGISDLQRCLWWRCLPVVWLFGIKRLFFTQHPCTPISTAVSIWKCCQIWHALKKHPNCVLFWHHMDSCNNSAVVSGFVKKKNTYPHSRFYQQRHAQINSRKSESFFSSSLPLSASLFFFFWNKMKEKDRLRKRKVLRCRRRWEMRRDGTERRAMIYCVDSGTFK